jgi:hypothetical protein
LEEEDMSLFKPATMQTAYLKMSLYGGAGSGKTYTSSLIAIGLAKHIKEKTGTMPPVMFLDTETGSDWIQPMFDEAGIELLVARTRAFQALKEAVSEAQNVGAILLVDSASHFWKELCESFLDRKRKSKNNQNLRLELPDWNYLKPLWEQFTTLYLNAKAHIIVCGRSGSVYEFYENEDTGKKEMLEVGTKMAAEKNFAYEPSLLVEMFSDQVKGKQAKKVVNRALVLKDRAHALNGREFKEPKFSDFLPHIQRLNIGGEHAGIDSRDSSALFPPTERDDTRYDKEILLENLQTLLERHGLSGTSKEAKLSRTDALEKHFKTSSKTEIERKIPYNELLVAYNNLHIELDGVPSRYFPAEAPEVDDEIPTFNSKGEKVKPRVSVKAATNADPVSALKAAVSA